MPANTPPNFQYPPTSRYYGVAQNHLLDASGRDISYLQRRFLPQPERFSVLSLHTVSQGERIDRLAAQTMGDAQAFWRILDANRAMRAEDVTGTIGQQVAITLPEGVPGLSAGNL